MRFLMYGNLIIDEMEIGFRTGVKSQPSRSLLNRRFRRSMFPVIRGSRSRRLLVGGVPGRPKMQMCEAKQSSHSCRSAQIIDSAERNFWRPPISHITTGLEPRQSDRRLCGARQKRRQRAILTVTCSK